MKKQIISWGMMLAAAFTLTNCAKEFDSPQETETAGYPFEIVASTVDTKTVNDGMTTLWAEGDKINLFHALGDDPNYKNDGEFTVSDVEAGVFTGTISEQLDPQEEYDWFALYPYSEQVTTPAATTAGYTYIGHSKGLNQTGYNSTASLKGSICPLYGVLKYGGVKPVIEMNHLTSVLAINVTNDTDEPLTITTASFTAPEEIVGSFYIDFTDKDNVVYNASQGYTQKTAVVNVAEGTALANGESAVLYLAIKPFTAAQGTELTLSVNNYAKKLAMPKDVAFSAGKIKTLNFSYNKVKEPEPEGAVKATLTFDDKAKRTAYDSTHQVWEENGITLTNNKGASTTNVGDYAKPARFYKSSDVVVKAPANILAIEFDCTGISSDYVTPWGNLDGATLSNNIVTFTLDGTSDEYSFTTPAQLRANSVTVTYVGNGGGDTPEPEARTLVSIAVADDAKTEYYVGEELVKPAVTATYDNGSTANVTASATFSGYDKTATGTQTVTVSYTENEVTATASYTVTVSEKEETGEPEEITVAEFLARKDTATEYILTGKITSVGNTSYGNFNLTDASGTIYVYGLLTPSGASQQQWTAAGLKQGDIITVKGVYNVYNESPQIKNAVYVSHKAINVDKTSYTFAAEGGSFDVTATLVNATDAISVSVDNSQFTVALKSGTTYTVTAQANQTTENIYANLTFTAGDLSAVIALTQNAPVAEGEVVGGRDDFNTVTATTSYGTYTSKAGWKGVNCAVLQGGTSDSNPTYKFIGSTNATRALCMNGKTSAKGSITSPTLTTGCGTLKFNYGLPYSDTKIKFKVEIKQNGTVVKTFTIDNASAAKNTKYSHEEEVNVAGDFQIVFTNLSPSNSTSNKDRTAIWDVEWTGCN